MPCRARQPCVAAPRPGPSAHRQPRGSRAPQCRTPAGSGRAPRRVVPFCLGPSLGPSRANRKRYSMDSHYRASLRLSPRYSIANTIFTLFLPVSWRRSGRTWRRAGRNSMSPPRQVPTAIWMRWRGWTGMAMPAGRACRRRVTAPCATPSRWLWPRKKRSRSTRLVFVRGAEGQAARERSGLAAAAGFLAFTRALLTATRRPHGHLGPPTPSKATLCSLLQG